MCTTSTNLSQANAHCTSPSATPPRERPPPSDTARYMARDIGCPMARAVVFSRPVRGFDTWGLLPLGPLHVELSTGHRWNHPPPTTARATAGTGGSGGGLVCFLRPRTPPPPSPKKENTSWHHTTIAARAATGTRRDRSEVPPVNGRQRGSNRRHHSRRRMHHRSNGGRHRCHMHHPQ